MEFRYEIFSVQARFLIYSCISVVTVIVTCLVTQASSQREDYELVEQHVSRMMSKYPAKEASTPAGPTGPNPGYEPYWREVHDNEYRTKCGRCPRLFQRYTTVCALDSTGEVMVNASMCKIRQMNCLNGLVEGYSTGRYHDYTINDFYIVQDGWARFEVYHDENLVVHLSNSPDFNYPNYEIIIDTYDRQWSSFTINYGTKLWYKTGTYSTLHRGHKTGFVVSWNSTSGWFLITLDRLRYYTEAFHFSITDRNPFPIRYIAIGGQWGWKGNWTIRDLPTGFVVVNMGPCKVRGEARPVPTSPTDVPGIMSKISPANINYFERVKQAGVMQDQVNFHTREEY